MHGLNIFARSNSVPTTGSPGGKPFQYGNAWQYHSRSDRHSKVACWGIMFDVLRSCPLLRKHIDEGKVGFGINHRMTDFAQNKRKNLDLVICRFTKLRKVRGAATFADLAGPYTVKLSASEQNELAKLPKVPIAAPSSVLVALEAKACMTAFNKAGPRLFDELNSSHLTVHGDSDLAIAAGIAIVNAAEEFISPDRNRWSLASHKAAYSKHTQPKNAEFALSVVKTIPRRSATGVKGFDALTVAMIKCVNDGTPVEIIDGPPAPAPSDAFHYDGFIERLSHLYATRFTGI